MFRWKQVVPPRKALIRLINEKGTSMHDSPGSAVAEDFSRLKARLSHRNHLAADCAELREKIEEIEREHRGIAFWLEESERELQRLIGGGLTGLVLAAFGRREEKIQAKQRELEGLREDCAAYGRLLSAAREDLERLEADLQQFADVQRECENERKRRHDALLATPGACGDQFRTAAANHEKAVANDKAIMASIALGREVIENLHDEVHAMA